MAGDLDRRLAALAEAADLADGRLDAELVSAARAVVDRAGARLGLGVETTVVALAGPTGSGKSRLFNALAGADLAEVGRRRPTTAAGRAAVWGDGAGALLDWLDIGRRHRVDGVGPDGLVLLDLPDFDSVEASHRAESDRVVGLADLVLWVADPQKYADASLHDRYLRPLASHAAATAVVLNQADLLARDEVAAWRADMERLLARDGLDRVPVLVVSALTGEGLSELRRLLERRVAARDAALARLAADVAASAGQLAEPCAGGRAPGVDRDERRRLLAALEEAAGVPTVLRAVSDAHRRRGALAAGWPLVRWVRRFRPDPLRRLRLPERPGAGTRTSVPPPSRVQQAQVATASRRLADGAAAGLAPPWPRLVREAAVAADDRLADRLDRAVAGADLHVARPRWWSAAALLQRALAVVGAVGAVWLLVLAALGYLRVDEVLPVPELRGVPVPTWLLLLGLGGGIALALLARALNAAGARRRTRAAARSLRTEVERAAEDLVVGPVEAELDARARLCAAVAAARGR